jgi:DNA-3-methyladenine glycosylase I
MSSDLPIERCPWCLGAEDYIKYHDEEWGVPVRDDKKQFEFLVLESAQAGLSWYTVLRKRSNYRDAYDGFDPAIVAKYGESKLEEMLQNAGLIRNRAKLQASINNAGLFLDLQQKHGSFCNYLWDFVDGKPVINTLKTMKEIAPSTPLSDKISKDLKQKGFKFMGTTIVYAHLQATGLVNDHLISCFRHKEVQKA